MFNTTDRMPLFSSLQFSLQDLLTCYSVLYPKATCGMSNLFTTT
jgi:hypothetical protein